MKTHILLTPSKWTRRRSVQVSTVRDTGCECVDDRLKVYNEVNQCFLDAVAEVSASCLTTAELQQHWRAVKREVRAVKLLFQIPSTRTIEHITSRYVVS